MAKVIDYLQKALFFIVLLLNRFQFYSFLTPLASKGRKIKNDKTKENLKSHREDTVRKTAELKEGENHFN